MSDDKFPCDAYKITILVLDDERYGFEEVRNIVESPKYASVSVVDMDKREVQWHDDHPLNKRDSWKEEFERMFAKEVE